MRLRASAVGLVVLVGVGIASPAVGTAAATKVRLAFVTPTVSPGGTLDIVAFVSRKALCRVSLSAADGSVIVLPTHRRKTSGRLSWTYRLDPAASEGTWQVRVACGRVGSAHSAFVVGVPVVAPPQIDVGRTGFHEVTYDTGDTFVDYGVELTNRSSVAAVGVTVTATVRDAAGASSATDTRTVTVIPAGSTFYVSGLFLFHVTLNVASLSVNVTADKGHNQPVVLPTVSHMLLTPDSYQTATLSGEVTNPYDVPLPDDATVYVVYFDAENNVIGGDSVRTGAEVQPRATVGFSIPSAPTNVAAVGASVDPCGIFSSFESCPVFTPSG